MKDGCYNLLWQQQHVRRRTAHLSDISSGATCVADLDSVALALTKEAPGNSRAPSLHPTKKNKAEKARQQATQGALTDLALGAPADQRPPFPSGPAWTGRPLFPECRFSRRHSAPAAKHRIVNTYIFFQSVVFQGVILLLQQNTGLSTHIYFTHFLKQTAPPPPPPPGLSKTRAVG